MPRPTKYTEDRAAAICKDVERGNTFKTAALANGIAYETLRVWREEKPAFSAAIEEAEAKAQREVVRMLELRIHEGATDLIKFYLTHRHGDEWKPPKQTSEISGPGGGPLQVAVERVDYGRQPDPDPHPA
jgi:hypothetical protein